MNIYIYRIINSLKSCFWIFNKLHNEEGDAGIDTTLSSRKINNIFTLEEEYFNNFNKNDEEHIFNNIKTIDIYWKSKADKIEENFKNNHIIISKGEINKYVKEDIKDINEKKSKILINN